MEAEVLVLAEAIEIGGGEGVEGGDSGGSAGGAEVDYFVAGNAPELFVGFGDFFFGGEGEIRQVGQGGDPGRAGEFFAIKGGMFLGVFNGGGDARGED